MDWNKATDLLKKVAPGIATMLGGPLAGAATVALSQALFGKDDATDEEIFGVLGRPTPEVLLKLKEADNAFKARMKELDIEEEKIHLKDRVSARLRDIKAKDKMNPGLGLIFTFGFFGVLYAYMTVPIPEQAAQPLNLMLGALTAGLLKILDYYFGSSKGSADKTQMLAPKTESLQ